MYVSSGQDAAGRGVTGMWAKNEKEELFYVLKSIEQRLSSVPRLGEETSGINLARLRMVL